MRANPAGEDEPIGEGMGALVANIPVVPPDVQCIEIQTTDYRVSLVRKDVTPGQAASFRLAPLSPGNLYVYGTAYSVPCANAYNYYDYGYGYAYDGGASSPVTWRADYTYAQVQAGRTNKTNLVFYKLADLNVDVQFQDPCVCENGVCMTVPQSGGEPQDCSVTGVDAGPDVRVFPTEAGAPSIDGGAG